MKKLRIVSLVSEILIQYLSNTNQQYNYLARSMDIYLKCIFHSFCVVTFSYIEQWSQL
jgi:hypothetical protein